MLKDADFQLKAQERMIDKRTIEAENQEVLNNPNHLNKNARLLFQYPDGTFAYGQGALENVPARDDRTDRLYVKVRTKHAKRLAIGGGSFNPVSDDVFILKSELDSMCGLDLQQDDPDPIRDVLGGVKNSEPWASDPRRQFSPAVSLIRDYLLCINFPFQAANFKRPKVCPKMKRSLATVSCCFFL
jgi:hypothetical protein